MPDICNVPQAAQTNAVGLATARGCNPGENAVWTQWGPNDVTDFSASLTKEARDPLSQNRGGGKSVVTALEAAPGFSHDLTVSFFDYFMADFLYTRWVGNAARKFEVAAITASGFELAESGEPLPEGALVHGRRFADDLNNGLHVVGAASTGTMIDVSDLEPDADPDGQIYHVGQEFPEGDVELVGANTLTSTLTDFTTLGYVVDQWIDVRGFAGQTNTLARIVAIAENELTLANSELVTASGTGVTCRIYAAQLAKSVPVGDPDFVLPEITAEMRYNSATPEFEYARRAIPNQITINLPVEAKSTVDVTWSAADIEEPTTTRRDGTWTNPVDNASMAPAEAARRVAVQGADETGLSSYLKDVTITINNNAGGESVWGDLTSTFPTYGNQEITAATEAVFIDGSVLRAARRNSTIQLTLGQFNEDGTVLFHMPTNTWDEPGKNLERDNAVKVTGTITAFTDPAQYRLSASLFWWTPAAS